MTIRKLECSCCGKDAGRWHQHWNQDHGYGVCPNCVEWQRQRGTPDDELVDMYGTQNINWGAPKSFQKTNKIISKNETN